MKKLLLLIVPFWLLAFGGMGGVDKSVLESEKFIEYDQNCTTGDSWSCSEVGMTYYKLDDMNKSLEYFTKACDIEWGVGCELKAYVLLTQKRYGEALPIFTKACDNNSSYSCLNLAVMYDYGQGVEANKTKADALYLHACKIGDIEACYMLNLR